VRPAAAVLGDHGLARVKVNCAFALARAATAALGAAGFAMLLNGCGHPATFLPAV
jgi:hypothetical protein